MSANYETSSVSVTMQGVVAFIHRTQPVYGSVLHNSPCSLRTCAGLAYFGLHRTCPHVYQPVVRGHLDPDFLHHVLPL